MKRIHKATVKKIIRNTGQWQGWICASNVNADNVNGRWRIGCYIEVESIAQLDQHMRDYAWYNCNGELGQRVYCWID